MKFSKSRILMFLSFNWATMIVLTAYFLGEKNETTMAIIGTLFIGFTLQLGFLANQLSKKENE